MPVFVNPIAMPQDYDVVKIGGVECPGICVLSGFKRDTEWDVKKGKGTKGGTATLSQLPPAKGSIEFFLWTAFHFEAWDAIFRARFLYDPTKKTVNAVDIYHPALSVIDIYSVVTESIGPVVHKGKQLYSITVELLEYLPPPKKTATGTPTGSNSKGGGAGKTGKSNDPIADAQQAEIAKLTAEAFP
jgi:hypothetical protein